MRSILLVDRLNFRAWRYALLVLDCRHFKLIFDSLAQRVWRDNFNLCSVFEDIHKQFTIVRIGQTQFIAPIFEPAAFLLGVPDFFGDPAGAFCRKAEHGGGVGSAGEDAVAAGEFAFQGGFGDGFGGFGQRLDGADAFDGEDAQAIFIMAPGVEIPVVAIVGEALGGYFAVAGFVALAVVVVDAEPVALQDGVGDGLEVARVLASRGDA